MPTSSHPNIRQCTHIKANGLRCGSPALKGQYFCFFHTDLVKGIPRRVDARFSSLANFEDADSIQLALMEIMNQLVTGTLDHQRANLMIKVLRLAVRNAKYVTFGDVLTERHAVTEVPDYAAQYLSEHPELDSPPATNSAPRTKNVPPKKKPPQSVPLEPAAASRPAKAAMPAKQQLAAPAAKLRQGAARGDDGPPKSLREVKEIRRMVEALPGAHRGNWKDLKTLFEATGIFPAKTNGDGG
jgi:hypothetical protein